MLSAAEILNALRDRGVSQADICRVLDLKSSRVAEMYNAVDGKPGIHRRLHLDEARKLVEAFGLESAEPVSPLSEQVARLVVLHVAQAFGVQARPDDERVEETALTIRAFSQFAADPAVRDSEEAVTGFFQGFLLAQGRAGAN